MESGFPDIFISVPRSPIKKKSKKQSTIVLIELKMDTGVTHILVWISDPDQKLHKNNKQTGITKKCNFEKAKLVTF